MKKRIKKKEYKAIVAAKYRLSGATGEHVLDVISNGYVFSRGADSRARRSIRKVVSAGTLIRVWDGWEFELPSTHDAMRARDVDMTIFGQLYNGQTSFEDCPYAEVTIRFSDIRKAASDQEMLERLCSNELIRSYLRDTFR